MCWGSIQVPPPMNILILLTLLTTPDMEHSIDVKELNLA